MTELLNPSETSSSFGPRYVFTDEFANDLSTALQEIIDPISPEERLISLLLRILCIFLSNSVGKEKRQNGNLVVLFSK